jgi:hypothetical protein
MMKTTTTWNVQRKVAAFWNGVRRVAVVDCLQATTVRRQGDAMKTKFVLIDYENVQPKNLELLRGGAFKIRIFLGAHQTKLPVAVVTAVQTFGADAEYIALEASGSNALDFCIAYYAGRISVENPGAEFLIVSKDTGFDPLIRHLKGKDITASRVKDLSDIAPSKTVQSGPLQNWVSAAIGDLERRKTSRPRTVKTLKSTIKALLKKEELSDADLDAVLDKLTVQGVVRREGTKVSYTLPGK